jgi:hypothetical protein
MCSTAENDQTVAFKNCIEAAAKFKKLRQNYLRVCSCAFSDYAEGPLSDKEMRAITAGLEEARGSARQAQVDYDAAVSILAKEQGISIVVADDIIDTNLKLPRPYGMAVSCLKNLDDDDDCKDLQLEHIRKKFEEIMEAVSLPKKESNENG